MSSSLVSFFFTSFRVGDFPAIFNEGESKPSEQDIKSQQGEITTKKNMKKRMLDADEDENSKSQSSGLENLKKVAKPAARKIEDDFERTEKDALPLACSICREPFLNPVVTNCHHYFCQHCALKHHAKNIKCFVCSQPTLGIFNTAVEIKERIAEEREKARVMVEEVSQMVEKASAKVGNAKAMAAEAAEMVKEVETLVEKAAVIAEKARTLAVDSGEIVAEADVTMERARTEMAKAFLVMKSVKWNV